MKNHTLITVALKNVAIALVIASFATACGKKEETASPAPAPAEGAEQAVVPLKDTPSTPIESAPATPDEGPQTHEEYVQELGKLAQVRQSFGRRIAMATEILAARERVIQEQNEDVRSALDEVKKYQDLLAAAEKTLAEAQQKLSNAYAADPEWAAAKEKLNAISKEAEAQQVQVTRLIMDAKKKGIRFAPANLKTIDTSAPDAAASVPAKPIQ